MKKTVLAFSLTMVAGLTFSQTRWDSVQIKSTQLTDQIDYLVGSGGNIGVFHGPDGILIIDDQYAQLSDKIMSAIKKISHEEFKYIVNSHYHGDHTGGNENLGMFGPSIIAHENVRVRLSTGFYSSMWEREVEAKPETFWPDDTFSDQVNLYINDEKVSLRHMPAAHTDGDVIVFFEKNNVIHTGDVFVRYGYPFIDVSAGGTIDGFIKAQEYILSISDENTQIIPGHGEVSSTKDVEELLDMLSSTRAIVAKQKNKGKSLDECLSASLLKDYHDRWNGSFIDSDMFVRFIYETIE